ncbi:MAG: hypothetical protein ACRDGR_10195 [bacterium]
MSRPRTAGKTRLAAFLVVVSLLPSCNIWEWTADDSSFDALLADGRRAIQDADYALAVEKFRAAVDREPRHAEARYYLAKATVLHGRVDVLSLVQALTDTASEEIGAERIYGFPIETANSLYRVNAVVLDALEPVHEGWADLGNFRGTDVRLDLAVAYILSGILRLRDTNGDGVIDENDLSPEELGLNGGGGEDFSFDGLDTIPPEDLNDMLDDLGDLFSDGGDLLLEDLGDHGIDVDELNDLIDQLGGDLRKYYVNTGVPGNPGEGDNDGDGVVDEECINSLDDDLDGLVDEDSRLALCP